MPRADLATAVEELAAGGTSLVLPPPHGRFSAELRLDPRGFAVPGSSGADGSDMPRRLASLLLFGFAVEAAILARFAARLEARDAIGVALATVAAASFFAVLYAGRPRRDRRSAVRWAAAGLLGSLAVLAVIAVGR